jgi:hypothetical protein
VESALFFDSGPLCSRSSSITLSLSLMSGTHVTSKQVAPVPPISQGRRYLNGALSGVVEVLRSDSLLVKNNGKCNSFFSLILC